MKKVLIVVDMLNDFIDEKGSLYIGPTGRAVIKPITKRVEEYIKNDDIIIFICDSHNENDPEFLRFPKHCVTDTHGAKVIPELVSKTCDNIIVVPKSTFDGFYGTKLDKILEWYDTGAPEMCEICGVCTSICCLFTAASVVNRGYPLTVHKDCVADFDQKAHNFALKHMEKILGVKVI